MSLTQLLNTFNDEKEIVKESGKYVEKDKTKEDLRGILQRERLKLSREATSMKRGVSFAPHAITYPFCRRMKIGQLAGFVSLYYDKFTPRMQTGMDIGTVLHDLVQTYFWNVGMLKGSFECLKCDKMYHNLVSPKECPSGKVTHKRKHLRFREITVSNEEYSLYGRSDGILVIEEKDKPLEIKSLPARIHNNGFQFFFDDLEEKGPRENHLIQLNLYMYCMNLHDGHLLYICKNDGRIKTYNVIFDEELVEPYLREIKYLKDLAARLKAGEKVDLPECCGDEHCACHNIISPMISS